MQLLFDRALDVPRYVRTDKVKLRQVLVNLLNNALKFTEEGGVTVRVARLMIDDWRLAIEEAGNQQSTINNQQSTIPKQIIALAPNQPKHLWNYENIKLELQEGR